MTGKDIKLIKEMLQMQAKLDEAIMKEYGLTCIDEEKLRFAIIDEVGELVDIWHFVLSWQNHFKDGEEGMINARAVVRNSKRILNLLKTKEYRLSEELSDLVAWELCKLERLIAITEYIGFTVEQVYKAYCGKNKINYQRLESGY